MTPRCLRNGKLRVQALLKQHGWFKFTLFVLLCFIIFLQLNQSRQEANAIVKVNVVKSRNSVQNVDSDDSNDETTTMTLIFSSVPSVLLGDDSEDDTDKDDRNVNVIHLNAATYLDAADRKGDSKPVSSLEVLRQYPTNDALKFIEKSSKHGTNLSNIRDHYESRFEEMLRSGPKRDSLSKREKSMLGLMVKHRGKGHTSEHHHPSYHSQQQQQEEQYQVKQRNDLVALQQRVDEQQQHQRNEEQHEVNQQQREGEEKEQYQVVLQNLNEEQENPRQKVQHKVKQQHEMKEENQYDVELEQLEYNDDEEEEEQDQEDLKQWEDYGEEEEQQQEQYQVKQHYEMKEEKQNQEDLIHLENEEHHHQQHDEQYQAKEEHEFDEEKRYQVELQQREEKGEGEHQHDEEQYQVNQRQHDMEAGDQYQVDLQQRNEEIQKQQIQQHEEHRQINRKQHEIEEKEPIVEPQLLNDYEQQQQKQHEEEHQMKQQQWDAEKQLQVEVRQWDQNEQQQHEQIEVKQHKMDKGKQYQLKLQPRWEEEEQQNQQGEQELEKQQLDEQWTDIEIHRRRFTPSENRQIYILGAVAKNSTSTSGWDKVAVYGEWYHERDISVNNLRCCYMSPDGTITEQRATEYNINNYLHRVQQAKVLLWHVTCDAPLFTLRGVSISRDADCYSGGIRFVRPLYAMKKPDNHLVITTKLAYGHIDAVMVINFLETWRYFGVDKVITYVYRTLDPKIRRILRYYAHLGLLEYNTIAFPDELRVHRKMPPHAGPQYMSDEWLLKRDALERSAGSTYFGIFDMDEFLVPSNNRNLKQLLSDLRAKFQNASHFFFTNVHFLTDTIDPSCDDDCPFFKKYIRISPLMFNNIHEKMILMTSRVMTNTIQNHNVTPLDGFMRGDCPILDAYVRHYGRCKRKFSGQLCLNRLRFLEDTSMVSWSESTVQVNIDQARAVLHV